jgi:protein phosphatase
VRRGNEDNFLLLDLSTGAALTNTDGAQPPPDFTRFDLGDKGLVLVVSDGMGGALAGDVASRMAVDAVREMLVGSEADNAADSCVSNDTPLVECLHNATVYANLAIHHRSQSDARCSGMGATFTGAAIKDGVLELVQVGDSRAYLLRGDEIKLATKDQSLVQQLVDVGQISEEEAETHMFRNVILQALGAQSDLTPATVRVQLRRGDYLLLCSDGLSNKLRAEDMQQIVTENARDLETACTALIDEANKRGGEDNITVVLARFTGDDLPESSSTEIKLEASASSKQNENADQDDTTETPN